MFEEIRSQQDMRISYDANRSGDFFLDQHGREWHCEIEIQSQAPCSPYMPHNPKRMPLTVPRQFMQWVRDPRARNRMGLRSGERQSFDILIDYDAWEKQCQDGRDEWAREMRKEQGRHPDWDDATLLTFVGPVRGALLPAVRAARDGNPYVLGLREADPNDPLEMRLKALLEPPKAERGSWFEDDPVSAALGRTDTKKEAVANRDERIRDAAAGGASYKEIGQTFGLTAQRVSQIVKKGQPEE